MRAWRGSGRRRSARVRQELAADLAAVAEDLSTGDRAAERRLDDVRARSLDAVRVVFDLDRARSALRWNPLRRRSAAEFPALEQRIRLAGRLYRHARSLARDVADAGPSLRGAPEGQALAAAARAVAGAADLQLRGEDGHEALGAAAARLETTGGEAEEDALV